MHISKKELLKNFSIGFIPILIFLIADIMYGVMIGIVVALLFGLAELLFFYVRDKKFEKFILFDIGLLVLFGVVSLLLENEFFFKLKPAVLEMLLVMVLAVHGFTNKPLLFIIGKRYMQDLKILPAQEMLLRSMTRIMTLVLFMHVLLIVWSAEYSSKEVWAFIAGGLFYIILGGIFVGQWFYLRFMKNKIITQTVADDIELFDIVNEQGAVVGKAPRKQVHGNPQLLHPTVHLHVFNKQGRLYLQKRSANKDLFPGRWDTAVGGHVHSGEAIEKALQREAQEELGLHGFKAQPLFRYVMRNSWESELVHSFKLVKNGPFDFNKDEIDEGRFWTLFEIRKNLGQDVFTPNFEQEFAMLEKVGLV